MPIEMTDDLLTSMVFRPFFDRYSHVLKYDKENSYHKHERYGWKDLEYREFIRELVSYLEPRYESAGTIIIKELDEFGELTFFIRGAYKISYSLNK